MLRDDDVVLIISNAPDLLLAKRIAHVLVEDGLAACVNLGAPGLSIYMWQGEVEGAEEVPIHIKTTYARHAAVVAALAQMHPYDVPEIIVLPVIGGAAPWTGCANRRPSCRTRETDVAICRYGWRPRPAPVQDGSCQAAVRAAGPGAAVAGLERHRARRGRIPGS